MNKTLATLAVLVTLVAAIFGATSYFATASDLLATEQRLDNYILGDRLGQIQDRIWKIEDRYKLNTDHPKSMPRSVKEELRELRADLELLKAKLKVDH